MNIREKVILFGSIVVCLVLQTQGADKYTDGNRPYEFGFSIDGEQHRHEKKDEKGLIEGEFGFITADGVYHVTVYATDEQGRFKILSMKNIRVKPYPSYSAKSSTSARQGHSLDLPASAEPSASPPAATTTFKSISIEPPARSCSHCSIPTTSTLAPIVPPLNQPNQIGAIGNPKFPQGSKPQSPYIGQPINVNQTPQQGFGGTLQGNAPNQPRKSQSSLPIPQTSLTQELEPPHNAQNFQQQGFGPNQSPPIGLSGAQGNLQRPGLSNALQSPSTPYSPGQSLQTPQSSPSGTSESPSGPNNSQSEPLNFQTGPQHSQSGPHNSYPGGIEENSYNPTSGNLPGGRTPKRLDDKPLVNSIGAQQNSLQNGLTNSQGTPTLPTKPTLISAQMQIVDKNTDIHRLSPGEKKGLPEGLTRDDMTKLLYTFNYTVGFHGHYEEGYINGAKQGYYFITGRNGVRTRVDYVADSNGFHPKISQEALDLLSDDVPKPETEKEEKYGLKGYEFKWLYYPVEATGR